MSRIRLAMLLASLVVPGVADAADGGIYLYLQPLPPEAARLTFSIAGLAAVASNGVESPLKLNLKTVSMMEAGRQRLVSWGRLPAGTYSGFRVTLKNPALKGEGLTAPDAPIPIDFPFSISQRQSSVVWLTLKYQSSMAGAGDFTPAFIALTPPKPISDHAGFVSNSRSDAITVFDKSISQAVAVIDSCTEPAGMALDQPRRRLYVACSRDDEVQSIDVTTDEVIERSRVSPGDRPRELAITPDGLTLLAVNQGSNSVTFFDARSLIRQERVNVGSGPTSIVLEPTGRRAYVFNTLSSSLSVIDLTSRTLTATVSTETAPVRGLFNRRGDRLFIIHERSPYLTVLDPRQLTIVTRARLRMGVSAIAIDPVRDLVCVGGGTDATVEFYDPNTVMPLYSMRARSGVSYLAIDAEENSLYMITPDTRSVAIASLSNRRLSSELDVGESPYWLVVMGEK